MKKEEKRKKKSLETSTGFLENQVRISEYPFMMRSIIRKKKNMY